MYKKVLSVVILSFILFGNVSAKDIPWSSRGGSFINPYANNGVCGIYNERAFSQDLNPSLSGLCYSGQAINLQLSDEWTWQCHVEGGVDAYCKAGRIPLTECGSANGKSFAKVNQVEAAGLCNTGKATPVFRDKNGDFMWACEPLNGESSNACRAKNTSQCGYLEGAPMSVYTPDYSLRDSFSSSVPMKNMLCKNKQPVTVTKIGNTFRWTCGTDQCTAVDKLYEIEKKFGGKVLSYTGNKEIPETLVLHAPSYDPRAKTYPGLNIGIYKILYATKSNILYLQRKDLGKIDGECGDTEYYRWFTGYYPLNPDAVMCKKGMVRDELAKGNGFTWTCEGINGGKDVKCSAVDRYYYPDVKTQSSTPTDNIVTTGLCGTGRVFGYKRTLTGWSYNCIPLKAEFGQDEFNEEHMKCNGYDACGVGGMINKKTYLSIICGTLYSTAIKPVSGLCEKGDPSEVTVYRNGKAWVWECLSSDRKGGNVSCYVEKLTTGQEIGLCGPSGGKSFTSKPATGLCDTGIPGDVEVRDGQYRWICKGINGGRDAWCTAQMGNGNPVNAQCGSSHGQSLSSAPAVGLCNSGTASSVSGSGPWTWTCNGVNGGSSASCRAEVSSTACNWTCSNWGACVNGNQTRTCISSPAGCTGANPYSTTQPCSIGNGFCGTAHGGSFKTKPTAGLCNNADTLVIVGDGPWYWICKDKNSDDANLCSATKKIVKVDGVCGTSHKGSFASAPTTGLCSSGIASPVYGNGPWVWLCNGNNGGSFAVCFALKNAAIPGCVSKDVSIPLGSLAQCCVGLVLCPEKDNRLGIKGVCRNKCVDNCTMDYAPVCGTDGKTYTNKCFAGLAGVGILHNGECNLIRWK